MSTITTKNQKVRLQFAKDIVKYWIGVALINIEKL